jgi:hypothetical protein
MNLPSRTTLIAIAAVIALPLIFAALDGGRNAGLALGVVLVAVGLCWTLVDARGRSGDEEE